MQIFSILSVVFAVLFRKAPASSSKKNIEIIFAALYFYLYGLKKCVSDCFFFSRYVQLKSSFSDEKNISGEI